MNSSEPIRENFTLTVNDIMYTITIDELDCFKIMAIYYPKYTEWESVIGNDLMESLIDQDTSLSPTPSSSSLSDSKMNICYDSKRKYQILLDYKNGKLDKSISLNFPVYNSNMTCYDWLMIEIITKNPYGFETKNFIRIDQNPLSLADKNYKMLAHRCDMLENIIEQHKMIITDLVKKNNYLEQTLVIDVEKNRKKELERQQKEAISIFHRSMMLNTAYTSN